MSDQAKAEASKKPSDSPPPSPTSCLMKHKDLYMYCGKEKRFAVMSPGPASRRCPE